MTSSSAHSGNIKVKSINGDEVVVARSLLIKNSPVLKSALEHLPSTESFLLQETTEIVIILKRFLEKGNFEFTSLNQTYELYKMTKFYQIEKMRNMCRNRIITQITNDTVCRIYEFSCHHLDRIIQYYCWRKFDECSKEVINSKSFLESGITTMNTYFSRPKYSTLNELTLFWAARLWASRRYVVDDDDPEKDIYMDKIRGYMNPFFDKIRFLTMDSEEMEFAFSCEVLYDDEKRAISSYVHHRVLSNLPPTICDNRVKRTEVCYSSLIEYKHHPNLIAPSNRNVNADSHFRCHFIPKEDCFLYEVVMPIITTENVSAEIKIKKENILFHQANYNCRISSVICLDDALFLQKHKEYLLTANLDLENINSEIKIQENSEFYMEESEYQHMDKSKRNEALSNLNEYFTKIRLYF